ncbi:unnamed protein product [Larinioides sclopetarius]|uniref:Uncharacterized protein n=1 Tax=Larinioides sclopetarius TaxID=280406 RepID=A0AAV2B4K1_9ARAC
MAQCIWRLSPVFWRRCVWTSQGRGQTRLQQQRRSRELSVGALLALIFELATHKYIGMEDHLQMNEMTHLNIPDRDRSRSASPADSLTSSATDISMLPIAGRSTHKRDDYCQYGLTSPPYFLEYVESYHSLDVGFVPMNMFVDLICLELKVETINF